MQDQIEDETQDVDDWEAYVARGCERAERLGNRGPMRFDDDGRLAQDILDAYRRTGFYVFTGVLKQEEIDELTREFDEILDNAPATVDGHVDRHGRPVKFDGYYSLSTDAFRGHGTEPSASGSARGLPSQEEPSAQGSARGLPSQEEPSEDPASDRKAIVGLVSHPLMMMDSALTVYGHPKILAMVASVNGEDFVPFHESVFHKGAGEGPPTPWHQDGRTHWTEAGDALERPDGSGKTHGFNLSVSWSNCTPENCLWVVPGSHRKWRLAGDGKFPPITERLPDAVPALLEPGDCVMVSRSSLHGSYPNRSPERRITMVLGFHKREAAIGAETTNVHAFKTPGSKKRIKYSEEYVLRRARMIPLAIDARRQRYPDETPYRYTGSYIGDGHWNETARAEISREGDEYWQRDITL